MSRGSRLAWSGGRLSSVRAAGSISGRKSLRRNRKSSTGYASIRLQTGKGLHPAIPSVTAIFGITPSWRHLGMTPKATSVSRFRSSSHLQGHVSNFGIERTLANLLIWCGFRSEVRMTNPPHKRSGPLNGHTRRLFGGFATIDTKFFFHESAR